MTAMTVGAALAAGTVAALIVHAYRASVRRSTSPWREDDDR